MSYRLFWLAIYILFAGTHAWAQDSSPPRDPQALAVLARSFAALGGANKPAISDLRVEGTLALPNDPDVSIGTFVAKARGDDFSVETIQAGQSSSYKVLNGRGSFRQGNKVRPLPQYNTHRLTLDILPLFARWTKFDTETVAIEPLQGMLLDGKKCLLIRVEESASMDPRFRNRHGSMEVVVEADTGLVVALRYEATQGPSGGDISRIENRFRGYKNFKGLLLPTQIIRYINSQPRVVLRIQSVSINNGLTDQDFKH